MQARGLRSVCSLTWSSCPGLFSYLLQSFYISVCKIALLVIFEFVKRDALLGNHGVECTTLHAKYLHSLFIGQLFFLLHPIFLSIYSHFFHITILTFYR